MLIEVFDIGVAAEEPEQFVDNRFEMELFGGEQRKSVSQREARLSAEDAIRAGAGAVVFEFAAVEHQSQEIEVLNHR